MSSPRAISELTMTPLYQYADHDPAIENRVESSGPRSKKAISFGCAASVQSNTEMPPSYHAWTITPRPGIGTSAPLWATPFPREGWGAGGVQHLLTGIYPSPIARR